MVTQCSQKKLFATLIPKTFMPGIFDLLPDFLCNMFCNIYLGFSSFDQMLVSQTRDFLVRQCLPQFWLYYS